MDNASRPVASTAEDIIEELESLSEVVESPVAIEELRHTEAIISLATERGLIRSRTRHLDPADAAEAFVGSVIFAAPLLVEDGVFDIAAHLLAARLGGVPVFLIGNIAFVVLLTYALLEWTGRHTEERLSFHGIPARLVMILVVSFVVAAALMTVWGRVDGWASPGESLGRVMVLWTVGSLGAALGDILRENEGRPPATVGSGADQRAVLPTDGPVTDSAVLSSLTEQFESLEATLRDPDRRRVVDRLKQEAERATVGQLLGRRIHKYTSRDVAEAFVGSVFFSIPFLVEDGVFDVAASFLAYRIGGVPVFLLVNVSFVLVMVTTLLYWAGPQDVEISRPLFGIVPRRLVGISVVSFLTVVILMTMWGRVAGWEDPVVAVARVSVVWTVASFGAALGDILPGESSGADINDELAELTELVGIDA